MIPECFEEFSKYLKVSACVKGVTGPTINVGEQFTLMISGANFSPIPQVVFKNARVSISATSYARPIESTTLDIALPDTMLRQGEASSVEIKMQAIAEIPGFWDFFKTEEIANVTIYANVDPASFFRVWNSATFSHEIDPRLFSPPIAKPRA